MSSHDWKYHCAVLSVGEQSSPTEIKLAYRKLALTHHPDRNGGTPQAKERFQQISASYQYLVRNMHARPSPPPVSPRPFTPPQQQPPPPPPPSRPAPQPTRAPKAPHVAAFSWKKNFRLPKLSRKKLLKFATTEKYSKKDRRAMAGSLAVACLAFFYTLFSVLSSSPPNPAANPVAAVERKIAAESRDQYGNPADECAVAFSDQGGAHQKYFPVATETSCEIFCNEFFANAAAAMGSCRWGTKEIKRATPPPLPPPPVPAPAVRENLHPVITFGDDEPDLEANLEVEQRRGMTGEYHILDFEFVPNVWVGQAGLLEVKEGSHNRQIRIGLLKRGATSVVITNSSNIPMRKIIFIIK